MHNDPKISNAPSAACRKMKRARCPFHQDAHSTKMPILPRCPFHQDAHSTKMPIPQNS
ncbi:MAG: hypothetical protein F6K56_36335 [Moorea sp. SIO3G5]|nr:hypothetical protein [Moorena sp. SIO3G5]